MLLLQVILRIAFILVLINNTLAVLRTRAPLVRFLGYTSYKQYEWNESNYYFKNGITLQLRWKEENIQRYTICKSAFFAAYSENHKYYVVWARPYIPGMRIEPELGKKPRRQLEGKLDSIILCLNLFLTKLKQSKQVEFWLLNNQSL
ncbi:Hypothetical_protein [Hexamita inflata]|uniref:Hypothetical_protein n=1 Tax=Hexamita inflata TaxID=28002 RepID=A0AA86N528_9EUKA|nr:Hypothetical protein HINF_LOCUS640 [Hexamita inflata]